MNKNYLSKTTDANDWGKPTLKIDFKTLKLAKYPQKILNNLIKEYNESWLILLEIRRKQCAQKLEQSTLKHYLTLKKQRSKYIKVVEEIPINFYKGKGFDRKDDEPLIEKSKILKAFKNL